VQLSNVTVGCALQHRVISSTRLSASQGRWDLAQCDRVAEGRPAMMVTSCDDGDLVR
jgi:hypothetical protein